MTPAIAMASGCNRFCVGEPARPKGSSDQPPNGNADAMIRASHYQVIVFAVSRPPATAFTIVELVVVIMILGILAAIAIPRVFSTSERASENSLRSSLSTVRDAIDRYSADHGGDLPGSDQKETTFKDDLAPYLRRFPANALAAKPEKCDRVRIRDSGDPLSTSIDNDRGWIYDNQTGEFRANNDAISSDGTTRLSEF